MFSYILLHGSPNAPRARRRTAFTGELMGPTQFGVFYSRPKRSPFHSMALMHLLITQRLRPPSPSDRKSSANFFQWWPGGFFRTFSLSLDLEAVCVRASRGNFSPAFSPVPLPCVWLESSFSLPNGDYLALAKSRFFTAMSFLGIGFSFFLPPH